MHTAQTEQPLAGTSYCCGEQPPPCSEQPSAWGLQPAADLVQVEQHHNRGLPEVVISNNLPFGGLWQSEERSAGLPVL